MKFRHIHMPPWAACLALRHRRRLLLGRAGALCAAADADFARHFPGFVAAVEAGFRHEELAMEMLGYARLREQREENAVILSALHRALPQVDAGDCALGRQLVAALRDVLALHRLSADLALSLSVPAAASSLAGRARGRAARTTQHVAGRRAIR